MNEYNDGGLSEADVDRTVQVLKRIQLAARIGAVLVFMGVGATATAIVLVLTGNAGGVVAHA